MSKGDKMKSEKVKTKKKEDKIVKTDEIIKVNNKILILETELENLRTGLKLALSRLGLQKELKNGK